jgi:hypothetical protein
MAKETIINVRVNTGNSAKDVKETEKAMDGFTQSLNENTKAKTQSNQSNDNFQKDLDRINKEVNSGSLSVRELTKRLKEYQSIALQAGKDSPIGRQAIKDASVLNDRIGAVRQSITTLADDGVKIRAALDIGTVAVSGYQGFLGVTQLLGAENEDLLKVLTKLQAAQGVLNSLQAIQVALKKEGAIANLLFNKSTLVGATVTKTATVATRIFNAVLKANPVFLIIGGITLLTGAVFGLIKAFKSLGFIQSEEDKQSERRLENYRKQAKASEQRVKDLQKEADAFEEGANFELKMLKALGGSKDEIFKKEQQIRKQIIANNLERGKELVLLNNLIIAERDLLFAKGEIEEGNELSEKIKANNELIKEINKGNRNLNNEIKIENARFRTEQENADKTTQEKISNQRKDERAKRLEQERKDEEERLRLMAEMEARLQDLRIDNIEDQNTQRIARLRLQQQRELTELRVKYGEDTEVEKELIIKQANDLQAVKDEIPDKIEAKEQERLVRDEKARLELQLLLQKESSEALNEAQIALWQFERDLLLANEDLTENERLKIKEEYRQKELELEQRTNDAIVKSDEELNKLRQDLARNSFNTILDLASSFQADTEEGQKRAFNIQKAQGIANALIDTYKSANSAYASMSGIPVVGPALGAIASATAIGAGIANVNNIRKQKFGGSGGTPSLNTPRGGDVSGGQNLGRDIQLFGSQNEGAEVLAGQQNQTFTIQAQVVETDMTATQNEVSDIEQLSQL